MKLGQIIITQDIKTKINCNVSEDDIARLNKIVYHFFIKKTDRWVLSPCGSSEKKTSVCSIGSYDEELPIASARARSIILIKNGLFKLLIDQLDI
jgi:hypothetical protein